MRIKIINNFRANPLWEVNKITNHDKKITT